MIDPIADMITQIRNALLSQKREFVLPLSKLKEEIIKIMEREGYIQGYDIRAKNGHKVLRVKLAYLKQGKPRIRDFKQISKPGRRMYAGYRSLKPVKNRLGLAIISTPQGLLTDREARRQKLGGEVLIEIF